MYLCVCKRVCIHVPTHVILQVRTYEHEKILIKILTIVYSCTCVCLFKLLLGTSVEGLVFRKL